MIYTQKKLEFLSVITIVKTGEIIEYSLTLNQVIVSWFSYPFNSFL